MKIAEKKRERTINSLKRAEGQIRGIQRMVTGNKDCLDVLTQVHAVMGALSRIEDSILHTHFQTCIAGIFKEKAKIKKEEKLTELVKLIKRFRKV